MRAIFQNVEILWPQGATHLLMFGCEEKNLAWKCVTSFQVLFQQGQQHLYMATATPIHNSINVTYIHMHNIHTMTATLTNSGSIMSI